MPGLQTVTTPVTATTISTTTFGTPVANNLSVLANPPIAKMRNSTTQSFTTATATAMTWDTEDFDTAGGHSITTNTSRYTCQTGYAGRYRVNAVTEWAINATGIRETWFRVNGANIAGSSDRKSATADSITTNASTIVTLVAGDYVEVFVQQTSGGALATIIGGSTYQQSYFEVQWISQ